jgi:hypothetical protein
MQERSEWRDSKTGWKDMYSLLLVSWVRMEKHVYGMFYLENPS